MKPTHPINATGRADWHYTHSSKTDLRKTFARIRKQQAKQQSNSATVVPMVAKRKQPGEQ